VTPKAATPPRNRGNFKVQAGVSLNAIQSLLGHRSLHTTSVYLQHIAPAAAVAEATAKTAHLAVEP
jgi:site-specific recombinase XerD